jgi:predicted O-linked N-acetylglucosamine transferase (SPINDLY family)
MALKIRNDSKKSFVAKPLPPLLQAKFDQAFQFQQNGQLELAKNLYEEILKTHPKHLDTLQCLGVIAIHSKDFELGVKLITKVIRALPQIAILHCNLGVALYHLKRLDEALASYDRALALDPNLVQAHNNRGNTLQDLKRSNEALESYDRTLAIQPNYAEAHNNRGNALVNLQQFDAAIVSYDKALALKPAYAEAFNNRGNALFQCNRHHEAIASCANALSIDPNYFLAHSVIGQCFTALGYIEQAIAHFDAAITIKPDCDEAISARIFAFDFLGDATFEQHRDVRQAWWNEVGSKIAANEPTQQYRNTRDPNRCLVVGYVSSDFRRHSAGLAFKPVLQYSDRSQTETVCYSCFELEDDVTAQFQALADRWRNASGWSDARLADEIRRDQIDILVDLSGHTSGNRLEVFARKPAPIQIHGWGHGTPPGLPTIDYVFSDPVTIPMDARRLFRETIYDLPCAITLEPLQAEVPRGELPALTTGYVTFGVFNRIGKISDASANAWAQILLLVPNARLVVKHWGLDDALTRDNLLARFAGLGVPPERIEFRGRTSRPDHLAALNDVDICLDTFPQNGGVSTWEALQMGVPVVALMGHTASSRVAAAILTAVGMADWVAESPECYVATAVARGSELDELSRLRRALPESVVASVAGNPVAYAEQVSKAYRYMWQAYCSTSS